MRRTTTQELLVMQNSVNPNSKVGVLLLHGLTGVPSEMRPLVKKLKAQGFRVETPLLPGHGGTHHDMLAKSWKDWHAGALDAYDKLSKEVDEVIVGGLSMGALLATMIAAERSVSGLILMSPTLRYDGAMASKYNRLLPLVDLLPILGSLCYWTEAPPYGLKDRRLQSMITRQIEAARTGEKTDFGCFRTYAGSLRQLDYLIRQVRTTAQKVTCPALIIHSFEDTLTSPKNATEMQSMLGSSDKSVVFLTGCDHVLTLDLRKEEVARKVSQFVCRLSWNVTQQLASVS